MPKLTITSKSPLSIVALDYLFIAVVICSGFLIYVHNFVPETSTWQFLSFEIAPKGDTTVHLFVYYAFLKFAPLVLFSVWYVTDKHWWKYALMVPIGFLFYQFLSIINDNFSIIAHSSVLDYIPYIIFYLFILSIIQIRLRYHSNNLESTFSIDSENLHKVPSSKVNKSKMNAIRGLLAVEEMNRFKLNAIYKEYDYLNKIHDGLSTIKRGDFFSSYKSLKLFIEVLIVLMIVLTPLWANLYDLIPAGIKDYHFGLFGLESHGFGDVRTFIWVLTSKMVIVLPLTLWFFTSRYWWKYFILIPFSLGLFQVIELFKSEDPIDETGIFLALPLVTLILIIMITFSLRIRKYLALREFYHVMEEKINATIRNLSNRKKNAEQLRLQEELTALIKTHKQYSPKEYLEKLKAIKAQLEHFKENKTGA